MKTLLTLIAAILTLVGYSQNPKKSNKILSIIPIYERLDPEVYKFPNDTNAYKLGYIPWILDAPTKEKPDTSWFKENAFEGDDSKRWIYIGVTPKKIKWYLYTKNQSVIANTITVWIRMNVPAKTFRKITYKNAEEQYLLTINLSSGMYKIIQNILFDETGKQISVNTDDGDFEYASPESMMELTINAVKQLNK